MSDTNWLEMLGWGEREVEDLRFAAFSFIKQGHYKTAIKFFESLIFLSKDNPYDLQTLGALHLQVGDNLASLNYLERALTLNPTHQETLLNKAKALFLLGYTKQGLSQSHLLEGSSDPHVSSQARALTLAYS